jgi:tetratricopeptide (TPR) repeat protein
MGPNSGIGDLASALTTPDLEPLITGAVALDEAIAIARSHLQGQNPDPHWSLPLCYALWAQGNFREAFDAAQCHHSALANHPDFLNLFGMVARRVPGEDQAAEAAFLAAIQLVPSRADSHYNLGNLYLAQERHAKAISCYQASLACDPSGSLTWLNLGICARDHGDYSLARFALQRCLLLNPLESKGWCNLGLVCHQQERFPAAMEAYQQALGCDQTHSEAWVNLAQAFSAQGQPENALNCLLTGTSLNPESSDALFNLALTRLLLGDFVDGWSLYESRFSSKQDRSITVPFTGPWIRDREQAVAQLAAGSELLVWSEQGLGDNIQFCRYLPLLQAMGFQPALATRPPLVRLLRDWLPQPVPVLDDTQVDPATENRAHVSLMSLPLLMGTQLTTIPCVTPYLRPPGPPPEPLLVKQPPGGLSIGVVWATNPENKVMYKLKRLPLHELLEPLLPGLQEDLFDLHSLQVGTEAEELDPYRHLNNIHDWNGRLGDFADTAHVVQQLDLVISVDTAVAHLAGALGLPTWLLLPFDADFRWLRRRADSPWYPEMRLFRQTQRGDWSTVVAELVDQLGAIYGLDLSSLQ